jgi:hypothetical protein
MRRLTLDYLKTEIRLGPGPRSGGARGGGGANSRLGGEYFSLLACPVPVRIGELGGA